VRRHFALLLVSSLMPGLAQATTAPIPSGEDSRIGILRNAGNDEIRLDAIAGHDLTILLPRGEQIATVELNDVAAWHASVAPTRDAFTIYALRVVSASPMTVRTDRATYRFLLNAALSGAFPYLVRIEGNSAGNSMSPPRIWTPPVVGQPGNYKLSGDKTVLPSVIRDDGRKTYLQWTASQPLPAVFVRDGRGREAMVDGYMRDGVFTIDHLVDRLVFRIDKAQGKARRLAPKAVR
jgi:type IV secretion system protein VirB9